MSWTFGLPLVLAGMFGPWLIIRRGARPAASAADPQPDLDRQKIRSSTGWGFRFSWRNAAIGLLMLAAVVQYIDRDTTIQTARSGLLSQLQDSSATGWEIRTASLPLFTLLNGSNEVQFILTKDEATRKFSVIVHGNCFTGCIATWNKLQAFGL